MPIYITVTPLDIAYVVHISPNSCLLRELLITLPFSKLFGTSVERFTNNSFFLPRLHHALLCTLMPSGLVISHIVRLLLGILFIWGLTYLVEEQEKICYLSI